MSIDTVFQSAGGGAATSALDYLRDAFGDISSVANSNNGLTDNANTNPNAQYFGNDDAPKYSKKLLLVKDLIKLDRKLWINGSPTYQIVWDKTFPGVYGYLFGLNINLFKGEDGRVVVQASGNAATSVGFGLTGKVRKVLWSAGSSTSSTFSSLIDNVAATAVPCTSVLGTGVDTAIVTQRITLISQNSALQTDDLHDYRMIDPAAAGTIWLSGAEVYFENAGANIEAFPGSTYIDKVKNTTAAGVSMPLASFGSSMGGKQLIYKTPVNTYASLDTGCSTIINAGFGLSGTNLFNVNTGTGQSYSPGDGLVVWAGTSTYAGVIRSISTDTLTLFPTLPFGLTGPFYRSFRSGPTYSISSTHYIARKVIKFQDYPGFAPDNTVTDYPYSKQISSLGDEYMVWGTNWRIGASTGLSENSLTFQGGSGFIQMDGYFSAMEISYLSPPGLGFTVSVNGLPAWNTSGYTNVTHTLVTDLANQWNSVRLSPTTAGGTALIESVTLYERAGAIGLSAGMLAEIATIPAYAGLTTGPSEFPQGLARRLYAGQLGAYAAIPDTAVPGGFMGQMISVSCPINFYGNGFAVHGDFSSGGTILIDGITAITTLGTRIPLTEGYHSLFLQTTGDTSLISAVDIFGSRRDIENKQTVLTSKKRTVNLPLSDYFKWYKIDVVGMQGGIRVARNGKWAHCSGTIRFTSAVAPHIPFYITGLNVDSRWSNYFGGPAFFSEPVGRGRLDDNSTANIYKLEFFVQQQAFGQLPQVLTAFYPSVTTHAGTAPVVYTEADAAAPLALAAGDILTFEFKVPILGWEPFEALEIPYE